MVVILEFRGRDQLAIYLLRSLFLACVFLPIVNAI